MKSDADHRSQRIARLKRQGRRVCPHCGFSVYGTATAHPQCRFDDEASQVWPSQPRRKPGRPAADVQIIDDEVS